MNQSPDPTESGASTVASVDQVDLRYSQGAVVGNLGTLIQHFGLSEAQVKALVEQLEQQRQVRKWDGRQPYRGLTSYPETDLDTDDLFFGREQLTQNLVQRLSDRRFLCLAGPSGSGKSSLLKAGLLKKLRRDALPGSGAWKYASLEPGKHPLTSLARAVAGAFGGDPAIEATLLKEAAGKPAALMELAERRLGPTPGMRLVVVVDQFEQLFTVVHESLGRTAFLDQLIAASTASESRIKIVMAIRADFLQLLADYPSLRQLINEGFELVGAMSPEELVSAMALPAMAVGATIEPDLVRHIALEMDREPGALPLMQFALQDLFKAQNPVRGEPVALRLKGYLDSGGLRVRLEQHADRTLARLKLGKEGQGTVEAAFECLITTNEFGADTKRSATQRELLTTGIAAPLLDLLIREFTADTARLLTTDRVESDSTDPADKRVITLAHDRLITAWPWLKRIADRNRALRVKRDEIERDAVEWERKGRKEGLLYHEDKLSGALELMVYKAGRLTRLGDEFVKAAVSAEERRTFRVRLTTWTLRGLSITAISFSALATIKWLEAQRNDAIARASILTAHIHAELARSDHDTALPLLLASEAVRTGKNLTDANAAAIRRAVCAAIDAAPPLIRSFSDPKMPVWTVAFSPDGKQILSAGGREITDQSDNTARLRDTESGAELRSFVGHEARINSVAFSRDGKRILTGSDDCTARLWDAASGKELRRFQGHRSPIYSVAFSPDGKWVLTGGGEFSGNNDNSARLWDATSATEIRAFRQQYPIYSVAFSPDGERMLTGSADGTARLWDMKSASEVHVFKGHQGRVYAVSFSPDGEQILTGSDDTTARLWKAASGTEALAFRGHKGSISAVAFSPDGRRILTGGGDRNSIQGNDNTVRLWDAKSGVELRTLHGHEAVVTSVAFSPDGKLVLTGSRDLTVRLWNLTQGSESRVLYGHTNDVNSVVFSSDGKWILTGSEDRTARLWDASSGTEVRAFSSGASSVTSVAFSNDRKLIATGSQDGTARLWDAENGALRRAFSEYHGPITSVAFSADGKFVLTGSMDSMARLWVTESGAELRTFSGHKGAVTSVAFSPNGKLVLAGSEDGTARLWVTENATELRVLPGQGAPVVSVAFSSDGKLVLTGSEDGAARLWDTASGSERKTFDTKNSRFWSAALSPDGRWILTASGTPWAGDDDSVSLWNVESGSQVLSLRGHQGRVSAVAFSPDGKWILTGGADRTARLWPFGWDELMEQVRQRIRRDPPEFTDAERVLYNLGPPKTPP